MMENGFGWWLADTMMHAIDAMWTIGKYITYTMMGVVALALIVFIVSCI